MIFILIIKVTYTHLKKTEPKYNEYSLVYFHIAFDSCRLFRKHNSEKFLF